MTLELLRTYYAMGTNGTIMHNGQPLCYTIELPWRNNATGISCIPEGSYFFTKRFSPKFQWHLQVMAVPNRDLILVHPANHALKELKGCIAPVSSIIGQGIGTASRVALQALKAIVFPALENGEQVLLVVEKDKPSMSIVHRRPMTEAIREEGKEAERQGGRKARNQVLRSTVYLLFIY